jgi:hypothetical protein
MKLEFVNLFSKNPQIPNFMKIHTVGAEFLHARRRTDRRKDGRTDMAKVIVPFRNFAKAPEN